MLLQFTLEAFFFQWNLNFAEFNKVFLPLPIILFGLNSNRRSVERAERRTNNQRYQAIW